MGIEYRAEIILVVISPRTFNDYSQHNLRTFLNTWKTLFLLFLQIVIMNSYAAYLNPLRFGMQSSIGSTKAPRPDGFTALFYQKYWSIVGSQVIRMVE